MSKVFVTQQVRIRDAATGGFRDKVDLTPATQYGPLIYIFGGGGQVALQPDLMVDSIEERLSEEKFDPGADFLLCQGDPVVAMQVFHLMMQRGGCRVLRWDNMYKHYTIVAGQDSPNREMVHDGN
jgi:hypothetical protein